jgi:excisionase family DNA binding protein
MSQESLIAFRVENAETFRQQITVDIVERMEALLNGRKLLVDGREMAKLLAVSTSSLNRMAKSGEIPSVRVGRLVRFDPTAVVTALTAKSIGGKDD